MISLVLVVEIPGISLLLLVLINDGLLYPFPLLALKDYTFQKVMETQKDLKDTDGFDWLESTELAIDKRKFLLNRMFVEQPIPQDED